MRSDAIPGQEPQPVVVLSYKFWLRHFFGDPGAVGKTLELNHTPYRIIGVAQPRFTWYSNDVYLPLKLGSDANHRSQSYDSPSVGSQHGYIVNLRLKHGITPQQGSAALQPLLEQFARDQPGHSLHTSNLRSRASTHGSFAASGPLSICCSQQSRFFSSLVVATSPSFSLHAAPHVHMSSPSAPLSALPASASSANSSPSHCSSPSPEQHSASPSHMAPSQP